MLQLTTTSGLSSLSYTLPDIQHNVTVHLSGSKQVQAFLQGAEVTHRLLEIPICSHWEPGAHWHDDSVEHIRIRQGRAKVWINGQMQELGPGEETVFQLFEVHNFCRADFDTGETLIIEEWVEDDDGRKEIFFRNAFSIVGDVDKFGGLPFAFLRFFFLCAYRDNRIAFCPQSTPRWLQRLVNSCIFGVIVAIGKVAGWRSWYEEYTPQELRLLAAQKGGEKEL